MKLTILGSGGALAIPRPFCDCKVCRQARVEGVPYERTGPSMYMAEAGGILFDTPEEVRFQLERENIPAISHIFYTHWHPDHTQGLRIIEHINHTYQNMPKKTPINVYIPQNAMDDFRKYCAALWYFESEGLARIIEVEDRVPIKMGDMVITPIDFQRSDRVRYGYLIIKDKKRALYAPCSTFAMKIDSFFDDLDCLIVEAGWMGKTEEVRSSLPPKHAWLDHVSLEENINLARQLEPAQTILTHVDGTRHLLDSANYDVLKAYVQESGLPIQVAFDGMKIII